MTRNPDRRFLLHHTNEGRVGLCASDDDHRLPADRIIAAMPFEQVVGLLDDIEETFQHCVWRDGGPPDED